MKQLLRLLSLYITAAVSTTLQFDTHLDTLPRVLIQGEQYLGIQKLLQRDTVLRLQLGIRAGDGG
jgi:hypothetical protein